MSSSPTNTKRLKLEELPAPEWEELVALIPHVFLPRRLPDSTSDQIFAHESSLLRLLTTTLEQFSKSVEEGNGTSPINRTLKLFKTWKFVQCEAEQDNLDSVRIQEAICSLEDGESFALYVRAQNAGLLISIPEKESNSTAIISSFPASLKSEVVMAGQDLACVYPALSVWIPRSTMLRSMPLADQLRDLTLHQCDVALPKGLKSGIENIENRDVPDPMLISKWLTTTLSDLNSEVCSDFPCIFKKVRDDVVSGNNSLNSTPFRRSGMYMNIKVILQLSLIIEFGHIHGQFLYKSIMIQFMTIFCQPCNNMDLGVQILAKISRRMYKLFAYFKDHSEVLVDKSYVKEFDKFRHRNAKILKKTRERLDEIWHKIIEADAKKSRLNFTRLFEFKSETAHLLQSSTNYFSSSPASMVPLIALKFGCLSENHNTSRDSSVVKFPSTNFPDPKEEVECGVALYDTEQWIQHHFENSWVSFSSDATIYASNVRDLFTRYTETGKEFYKQDPLGYSRFVLTCFKFVQVFDKMVVGKYQLLKDHGTGISTQCIPNLLLDSCESLELAQDIEAYFHERDLGSKFPSLIDQNVNNESFSNRFASEYPAMLALQTQILATSETQAKAKREEVIAKRQSYRNLQSQSDLLEHSYGPNRWGVTCHLWRCQKCYYEKQAEKCMVSVYEKPLPEDSVGQLAIAFELLIPAEIACLRDIFFILASQISVQVQGSSAYLLCKRERSLHPWTNYFQLSQHNRAQVQPNSVHLVSTATSFTSSHYSNEKHVSNDDSNFIVKNSMNTKYGSKDKLLELSFGAPLKSPCILKVELNSAYNNLQWMVNSTKHTQNEVLARQAECHRKLDLTEFKMFGTIRAGHRLQLRNVYSALAQGNLTIKSESVFALICQSLWEAGPRGPEPAAQDVLRDSHQDVKDSKFSQEFLKILSIELEANSKNWNQPFALLTLIVIGARILALSDDKSVESLAVAFLEKCRKVANRWVVQIKKLLAEMTQAPQEQVRQFRTRLIECAVCSALTFAVDSAKIGLILRTDDEVVDWLQAIVVIDDNLVIKSGGQALQPSLQNLLRRVRNTGLALEPKMHELIGATAGNSLTVFARRHWNSRTSIINNKWQRKGQSYFYRCSDEPERLYDRTLSVEIDVVLGTFLVNQAPVGRLPEDILKHPDYARVFQSSVFEVFSEGQGIYVSALNSKKVNYKFCLGPSSNDKLLVVESRENGENFQLIEHYVFGNDLPSLLIENTSHWWNRATQTVEFRPQFFSDKDFNNADKVKYKLELHENQNLLQNISSGKRFVDINEPSFAWVQEIMQRFEHPHFIHLMYSESKQMTTIELPRMRLNFEIKIENGSHQIISLEFPDMQVAKEQKEKVSTLIGLEDGLLLEHNFFTEDYKFLVPYGQITLEPGCGRGFHQRVKINNDILKDPPYFCYEVDNRLQQLKAGQCQLAWLYLAELHAKTASPLPDPFTGLTGTEAALKILQSGHCWSCEPFSKDALNILQNISRLTPSRRYHPPHLRGLQIVGWPPGLSSVASNEGFKVLVNKLVSDSNRLNFLFPTATAENNGDTAIKMPLTRRAYHRSSAFAGEAANLSQRFHLSKPRKAKSGKCFDFDFGTGCQKVMAMRQLAHLGHNWTNSNQNCSQTRLQDLLLQGSQGTQLQGVSSQGFPSKSLVTDWLTIKFKDCSWFDLYNFARNVCKDFNLKTTWTMLLCLFAFNGAELEHLLILQVIAVHPTEFPEPPPYPSYVSTMENEFNRDRIKRIFGSHGLALSEYLVASSKDRIATETEDQFQRRMAAKLKQLVAEQTEFLTQKLESQWPIESCGETMLSAGISCPQVNVRMACQQIDQELGKWFRNRELKLFLEAVMSKVIALTSGGCCLAKQTAAPVYSFIDSEEIQFLDRSRMTLTFDNFIPSTIAWRDDRNKDAADIFHNGRDDSCDIIFNSSNTDVVTLNCDEEVVSPPRFPFKGDNTCAVNSFYIRSIAESWKIHQSQRLEATDIQFPTFEDLIKFRRYYEERADSLWKEVKHAIYRDDVSPEMQALFAGGIFPRLTPTSLVPLICCRSKDGQVQVPKHLYDLIGATCVIWTLEQRAVRCLRYMKVGSGMRVALTRELENLGHKNWSPARRPEWLLLELEMDLMIRPVQVKVAEQMLEPPGLQNAVMQLNMGEGKTAVIIPLLVLAIADGSSLSRVTVLRSLFEPNLRRLILCLGGLLNRRVYNFPCRREMKIGAKEVRTMYEIYKECLSTRGIVLARPEHRLSLQLKGYESSRAGKFQDSIFFFKLQVWLKKYVRDVLDESDEILHVKYQLIYTVGEQLQVDGGSLRWTIAQDILKLLQTHAPTINAEFGENSIEFRHRAGSGHPGEFPQIRLLDSKCYPRICELIAADFVEGRSLQTPFPAVSSKDKAVVINFLTLPSPDPQEHYKVIDLLRGSQTTRDIFLILRGLLACGVLQICLAKRWKVNYGVDPKGMRLMSVPFRAKDVAMEKTEFGHPDVGILLTHLSYYYSGLSESQMNQCFDYLGRSENPHQEYERWLSGNSLCHPSIRKLTGVNLNDPEQKTRYLYPTLKFNTVVINFWLGHAVFPKESKQFSGKMVCTAWDLSTSSHCAHPVTGFSGTNDSALLLPLTISQKDLPELQGTNGQVLYNLMLPENNNYDVLPPGATSSEDILKFARDSNCRVLLDVGALIVELTNEQAASGWLKLLPTETADAVVYVDDSDILVVQARDGKSNHFASSSYRERLDRCVIYLDDIHTRGTDLKMPSGFKACVTLGTGVTKDKLVQGCMRMRMLGQGHTVHFLATREVDLSLRSCENGSAGQVEISAENVLQWVMANTCAFTRNNMLYWAAAGFNFAQKQSADDIFRKTSRSGPHLKASCSALSDQCTDKEVTDLMTFYGGYRNEQSIPTVAGVHQNLCLGQLKSKLQNGDNQQVEMVTQFFNKVGGQIIGKCEEYVKDVKVFAQFLDEEQERELEHEVEAERQISRPARAYPNPHNFNPGVKDFLETGIFKEEFDKSTWAKPLPKALENTALAASILQKTAWGKNIFATNDFVDVVKVQCKGDGIGEFLRTPAWIAVLTADTGENGQPKIIKTMLILSPYEANELLPSFRAGKMKATLHMYAPKLRPTQDILLTKMELALPSNNSSEQVCWENFDIFNANLSMFAGGQYFADAWEQEFFCQLFGYISRPWSEAEQEAFNNGFTQNGFIKPEFRTLVRGGQDLCKFQKNPEELIRKIIIMRHGSLSTLSHVSMVIAECKKFIFSKETIPGIEK